MTPSMDATVIITAIVQSGGLWYYLPLMDDAKEGDCGAHYVCDMAWLICRSYAESEQLKLLQEQHGNQWALVRELPASHMLISARTIDLATNRVSTTARRY